MPASAQLKKIILIAISLALLGGSAYLLYQTFGSGSATTVSVDTTNQDIEKIRQNSARIFPYGEDLNFEIVRKYNNEGQLFFYPQLDPLTDLGVPLSELVKGEPEE